MVVLINISFCFKILKVHSTNMTSRLDIILFGASGYTGKRCIESLIKFAHCNGKNYTWGIAGRSQEKLQQSLLECQNTNGKDLSSIPIVLADAEDYESLKAMTTQAKVLINCCGPYRFFGEFVVKACIETGTHQVDVSGEPQYMETMQLKYHKEAQEKGVYIVSACGFDSIPGDLGIIDLERNFQGTLNSAEVYMQFDTGNSNGPLGNYGTWESLIYSMLHAHELKALRKQLFPTHLPKFLPTLKPKPSVHKFDLTNTWNVPFLGADRSVITRTQRYLYEHNKKRPVQVQIYLGFKSLISIMMLGLFKHIFSCLIKYNFGRRLLLNYPKFFSYGLFSYDGPTRSTAKGMKCLITCVGKGWTSSTPPEDDSSNNPPTSMITMRISGTDPFYGLTCDAVTLSALVILEEGHKLPNSGGVYTPGAAFLNTSLLARLKEYQCLSFEVVTKI